MFPKLGNLCIGIVDEGLENESLVVDVEGCSMVVVSSREDSGIVSSVGSAGNAGLGTKNFALAATFGLIDGTEGD